MIKNQTKIRVRYGETDQMGYVYYGNYAQYFEVGRVEWLRSLGISYRSLEESGVMLPVIEAHCRYVLPAHYDDLLDITGRISSGKGTRIRIDYEVNRDNDLLVEGYTVHACLNKSGRPTRLPEEFRREPS